MKKKPGSGSKSEELSLDQAVKDLLTRFPLDAWRFLLPRLHRRWGDPTSWEVLRSEGGKNDLRGRGLVMDVPIRYAGFRKGENILVVVLVEHWATSRSVDLHRTAQYVIDLMRREPGRPVLPVALITDLDPKAVEERLVLADPLGKEPIFLFRHLVRLVACEDLAHWSRKTNVVASALAMAMAGDWTPADKARLALLGLERTLDAQDVLRLCPMVFRVGKLTQQQQEEIMTSRSALPEPHLFRLLRQEGRQEGHQEGRQEGRQEGLDAGRRAERRRIARQLRAQGFDQKAVSRLLADAPELRLPKRRTGGQRTIE